MSGDAGVEVLHGGEGALTGFEHVRTPVVRSECAYVCGILACVRDALVDL